MFFLRFIITGGIERGRRITRSLLPQGTYDKIARVIDAFYCLRKIGWRNFRRFQTLYPGSNSPSGDLATFNIPGLLYPLSVRKGTSDATEVVRTVIREVYGKFLPPGPIRFIVDAGANIGDTAAWYLSKFQEAKVVAIEPDPENFRMVTQNLTPYGERAILLHAGLWPRKAKLRVCNAYPKSAVSVVEVPEGQSYDCVGVAPITILRGGGEKIIDIFKCDIEGAELELFLSDCDSWLSRTQSIYMEIHSEEAKKVIMSATRRHSFNCVVYRDLHIFRRSISSWKERSQ